VSPAAWAARCIAAACMLAACGPPAQHGGDVALVGARIHTAPGVEPIAAGVVLVQGGKIAAVGTSERVAVPDGTLVLDCTGLTLAAGFWNSHVHFTSPRVLAGAFLSASLAAGELRDMLGRFGFVHVVDTGSPPRAALRLRALTANGALLGPEIRTTGEGLVAPGGSPFYLKPFRLPAIGTPDEARAAVRERLDAGADGIKLFTGGLATPESVVVMDVAVVRAVTEAAHARGAFVIAHPSNSAGARAAVEGGVDILAHTFPNERDGPWDRSLPGEMKARGMALIPTLKLWKYELERMRLPAEAVASRIAVAEDQVRSFAAQGGQLLFGTDVGYMRDFDPSDEYRFLAEAGLSFRDVLAILTTAPAERFGAAQRTGRIEPGFDADLVGLDGDPEADPAAWTRVRFAMRRGAPIYTRE
jgi:imidazolonepropionase-like amidohydrolase